MEITARHELYSHLDELLAPETLSRLVGKPVRQVKRTPLSEHDGVAGGKLTRITSDAGAFIVKQMDASYDYSMWITNDHRCRSVALWQYGLLDDLEERFLHKILACSHDQDGWGILMEDLGEKVFHWSRNPILPHQVEPLLDNLAWQHARYWNRTELLDPRLGLCSTAEYINVLNLPSAARIGKSGDWGIIPGLIQGGRPGLEVLLDEKTFMRVMDLANNPVPLIRAIECLPATFFHGDCRTENIGFDGKFVLLDWQMASFSLPTAGLGWAIGNGFIIDFFGDEDLALDFYRGRLEAHLDERFHDEDWESMVDLGLAANALRSIWLNGNFYMNDEDEDGRAWHRSRVMLQSQRLLKAARWF